MYEIKVFDNKGKLKEILKPVFNYSECASLGTTTSKACKECGKISQMLKPQKFCSSGACSAINKARITKAYRARKKVKLQEQPTRYCKVCAKPIKPTKRWYCTKACEHLNRRNEEKAKAAIIREIKKERNIKPVHDKGN